MKFGSKVAKGTEDADTRFQIENEASEDVRNYLESKNISGLDYSIMPITDKHNKNRYPHTII